MYMDKGLNVPRWVLIVWSKIPLNASEFICPSPKVLDLNEKKFSLGVRSLCTQVIKMKSKYSHELSVKLSNYGCT